jgi:2-methylcitrate dehydratase
MRYIAQELAAYAHGLRFESLGSNAVREAKLRLMDGLGCAMGALAEKPSRKAYAPVPLVGKGLRATLLAGGGDTSPEWAAWANGYAVRYLDWNDTYLSKEPAHPSDCIGAVLACAEAAGKGGKDLLMAMALSYEVQCRLCDAASLRAKGWDHVNYLLVSTALAAGKLLGLKEEQLAEAVNIALNNLSTRQNRAGRLGEWKAGAAPNSARNGVFAALLAKEGFAGPEEMFEGKWGFQALVSGPFQVETGKWGGGERPFLVERTILKKHNAEIHSQSAVDAALALREKLPSLNQVEGVLIETHEAGYTIIGSGAEKWAPENKETADHSLPYIVSVALFDGEVGAAQYRPQRIKDPKVRKFLQRVKVQENKAYTAQYPAAQPNKVMVKLQSGKTLAEEAYYPRGHPGNPMGATEVEEKFRKLARASLNEKRVEAALAMVRKVEELKSVDRLVDAFVVK